MLTGTNFKKEEKTQIVTKAAPIIFKNLQEEEKELEKEKQRIEEEIKKERNQVILKKTFNRTKIRMIVAASKRRNNVDLTGLENLTELEGFLNYRQKVLLDEEAKGKKENKKEKQVFTKAYFSCKKGNISIFKNNKSRQALQHFSLKSCQDVNVESITRFSFVISIFFHFYLSRTAERKNTFSRWTQR